MAEKHKLPKSFLESKGDIIQSVNICKYLLYKKRDDTFDEVVCVV